jgi:predicted RecA/RadA family phage recombinase
VKNYVEPGEVLQLTAPGGGVVAGSFYTIGGLFVVATVTAAAGAKFSAYVGEGVVEGPKDGNVWTECVKISWDGTKFTTGAGTLVGVAALPAAAGDAKGFVRLDGVTR